MAYLPRTHLQHEIVKAIKAQDLVKIKELSTTPFIFENKEKQIFSISVNTKNIEIIDFFVQKGLHQFDFVCQDSFNSACQYNDVVLVDYLISCGFDPLFDYGHSLRVAAGTSSINVLKYLARNYEHCHTLYHSALVWAAGRAATESVQYLLTRPEIQAAPTTVYLDAWKEVDLLMISDFAVEIYDCLLPHLEQPDAAIFQTLASCYSASSLLDAKPIIDYLLQLRPDYIERTMEGALGPVDPDIHHYLLEKAMIRQEHQMLEDKLVPTILTPTSSRNLKI